MPAKKSKPNKSAFVRALPANMSAKDVVAKAEAAGFTIREAYVAQIRYLSKPKKARRSSRKATENGSPAHAKGVSKAATYPRHTMDKCIRLPKVIFEQNAGKPCSREQIAKFLGIGLSGELNTEVSSATKYGFLEAGSDTNQKPTDLAKRILRPQSETDSVNGYRDAMVRAPQIGDVYQHYRGEFLPERVFFENALVENFRVPREKVVEFIEIFMADAKTAAVLLEEDKGRQRLVDVGAAAAITPSSLQKATKAANVTTGDTCFVMMPFSDPLGKHYELIYKPAIVRAGLTPVRADSDIFGTGKIIDQILSGILAAKVLVAELTGRNPNVFYELGLAHALKKPVVLISADEQDVPFDVRHIRVIGYEKEDPFWGEKLIAKVAENIVNALQNPAEAILALPG
jgi:hypothetical protein